MSTRNIVIMFVLAAIWGASFMLMRITVPAFGSVFSAFGRVGFAALGLMLLALLLQLRPNYHGRLLHILFLGALNAGLPFLLFTLAARVLPAGYSAIINAMTPLMAVLIGITVFGEQSSWSRLLGVLIGLIGVAVLAGAGPVELNGSVLFGVAQCLLATVCYALAMFLTRRWLPKDPPVDNRLIALASMSGAVIFLLPIVGVSLWQEPVQWNSIALTPWLALLALGLIGTSFAFVLFYELLAAAGPVNATLVTFIIPPFGVFWGWLLLGERVGVGHAIGGLLVMLALWLVVRPRPTAVSGQ